MSPSPPLFDSVDIRRRSFESARYFSDRSGRHEDFKNSLRVEFGIPMKPSDWTVLTPLGNLVCHVVGVGSKEQMLRIHARSVIAPMKNADAVMTGSSRRDSMDETPRNPVSKNPLLPDPKPAVSVPNDLSRPGPAPVCSASIDLAPEARDRARIVFSHGDLLSVIVGQGLAGLPSRVDPTLPNEGGN